ncbi:MAG: glucosyltransferase domain-containing protein [Peptococcaceae bacterium]|nr:glucosyltransferase domain-containing protein [Peptococcaceae bacterium]
MFEITYSRLNELFKSHAIKILFLVLIIALCYGYEIFNFNMTIDEEIHSDYVGWIAGWNSQGRWGMGLLSVLLMPSTVVPTVSVLIGLCLTLLAFYVILKDAFRLDEMAATFVAALSITIPTLSFTFTFSTIAYGIGIGFAALAIAFFLIRVGGWLRLAAASALAGFSIGIYQTFVVVVLLVAGLAIWAQIEREGVKYIQNAVVKSSVFILGAIVVYAIVDILSRKFLSIDLRYVSEFVNFGSFLQSPWHHFLTSISRTVNVIALSSNRFGLTSPWLSIAVLFALFVIVFNKRTQSSLIKTIFLGLLIGSSWLICVLADAFSVKGAPLRSVIYIPLVAGLTLAAGYNRASQSLSVLLSTIIMLAIVGNSVVSNHLFASNAYAERLDGFLATEILREVKMLRPSTDYDLLKLEVVGKRSWPLSRVMSKKETFGASFFEWGDGNRYRIAAYLRTKGLVVVGASEEERVRVWKDAQEMPCWPKPGWVRIRDGVLVVKLSDYTPSQKKTLNSSGIAIPLH